MNVDLILQGAKLRAFCADGVAEYQKRLSRFCAFNIIKTDKKGRVPVNNLKGRGSCVNVLISGADDNDRVLDVSSEEFSAWMRTRLNGSCSGFAFWLPDSNEPAEPPFAESNAQFDAVFRLTVIPMGRDLTALILAEQIYRAFMIMNGMTYHK